MNPMSRLRQIALVSGVESFGVVVAGVAGLLIVNVLPKDQYAQYTFLVACMQLILGITDMGLVHCALPVVGERTKDVPWVVGACMRIFHWRWLLLVLSFVIVLPYWWQASWQHAWMGWPYIAAAAFVLGSVIFSLREAYANTVQLIIGNISTINKIGFYSAVVRLGFVGAVLLLPITSFSVTGIMAATAAAGFVSITLYSRAFRHEAIAETKLPPVHEKKVDGEVKRIIKPLVLYTIFYQFQGVITIFLASLFGNSAMLAEVGAFGRLTVMLVVVDRVTNILLFPVIARARAGPRLISIVGRAHLAYFVLMATVFASSVWLPKYWILLIGEKYRHMEPLVWMIFLSSILMFAAGFAFRTLSVRGLTAKQSHSIPFIILIQAVYLWQIGANDLRSVLGFGIASSFAHFFYQYILLLVRLPELKNSPPENPAN